MNTVNLWDLVKRVEAIEKELARLTEVTFRLSTKVDDARAELAAMIRELNHDDTCPGRR